MTDRETLRAMDAMEGQIQEVLCRQVVAENNGRAEEAERLLAEAREIRRRWWELHKSLSEETLRRLERKAAEAWREYEEEERESLDITCKTDTLLRNGETWVVWQDSRKEEKWG